MEVFGGEKETALPGESHWSVRMSVQTPRRCPPSPFSMTSFASPSHAPLSRLRPPLSQFSFALRSYHTSPDFIWPSPANQRPTSGWSPWQPTGPNIRGFKRWAGVWFVGGGWRVGGQWEIPWDWQLWWTEQNTGLNDATLPGCLPCLCVYVCPCARGWEGGNVCVNSFPLSQLPIPWTQWEWVELEGCLWAECVWEKAWYRERSLFSVQKGSDQPQQWLWFINIFRYTIVFFSSGRREVLSAV